MCRVQLLRDDTARVVCVLFSVGKEMTLGASLVHVGSSRRVFVILCREGDMVSHWDVWIFNCVGRSVRSRLSGRCGG